MLLILSKNMASEQNDKELDGYIGVSNLALSYRQVG